MPLHVQLTPLPFAPVLKTGFYNGLNDSLSALGKALAPTATGLYNRIVFSLDVCSRTPGAIMHCTCAHCVPCMARASSIHSWPACPYMAGALFAAMTKAAAPVFPFDEHLPFFFVASLSLCALLVSFRFYR